ncbi:MAG TPA: YihY/virulence factor BrkB family protein [Xanthobacteraceae bacterium]
MRLLGSCYRIALNAWIQFLADDGWAIASHIALSALMSLFPFIIIVTALAGFFGTTELADEVARILLEAWPTAVAEPIAREIRNVLTTVRGDVLTVGVVLAVYFASSGIESLRIGLNRAYGMAEIRTWWLLRLESIGYMLLSAAALLVMAVFVVLAPLIMATAVRYAEWLAPFWGLLDLLRLAVAAVVLIASLIIVHKWLPAGRRKLREIAPGIVATLVLWLIAGELFGSYLARFAYTYVTYYAGLASAMIALVFLYVCASIFIYGGELNAAITRSRIKKAVDKADSRA